MRWKIIHGDITDVRDTRLWGSSFEDFLRSICEDYQVDKIQILFDRAEIHLIGD